MDILNRIHYLIFCSLILILISCVGTIEEKNPPFTKPADIKSNTIPFNGLTRVIPISNTRVELYFNPAPGVPDSLTYLIYINNALVPIEVKGSALEINPLGEYRFTVSGLTTNTLYQFRVGVRNAVQSTTSDNDKTLQARTFSNITASFNGAAQAYPASGLNGQTSIIVEWVPALTLSPSIFSPRITDPIAYEIKYMPATAGSILTLNSPTNPHVITQTLPSVVNEATNGSEERSRLITGLAPGTTYYFQVRAIHKSYGTFKDNPEYKYEQNTRIVAATTRSIDEQFSFNRNTLNLSAPSGQDGLNRAIATWGSAQGPYVQYRLYTQLVAGSGATPLQLDNLVDPFDDEAIDILNADSSNYILINPGETTYTITNLLSYNYYHAKLVVCLTVECDSANRERSNLILYRVVPKVAAFDGVSDILNPIDANNINRVTVTFSPPVTTVGILTGLEVYCYSSINDPNPVLIPVGGVVPPGTKPECDGLTRLTPNPVALSAYSNFSSLILDGVQYTGPSATNTLCLSVVPVIEGENYIFRDFSTNVIRCARPEIQLPSVEEFPGAVNICNTTSDTLNVRWTLPTGGLYSNFQVFWKEVDGSPYKFSEAISGNDSRYVSNEQAIAGNTMVLNANQTEYLVTGLKPGRRYQYGVLAYVTQQGSRVFSEFNQAPRECSLPLPKATFDEWVHISALGPKESGLHPTNHNQRFILETFDVNSMPIEVDVDGQNSPTEQFSSQFGPRHGHLPFDGVYGAPDGNALNGLHQYSNSGMVQLVWKDVIIDAQTPQPLRTRALLESSAVKSERSVGYRVYRSSDGMNTWVDLTSRDHDFQTPANEGLLHPIELTERIRSNEPLQNYHGIVFTDYSVQAFDYRNLPDKDDHDLIDRARVYYYKVVPVLDGMELSFNNENQNIIRVTLPPRNQALVHRAIANRQTCNEMSRAHTQNLSTHYTCQYNGVGSRSLTSPWRADSMVYDLGGDVLVDRFELGCDYSRGDISNARSHFDGSSLNDDSYDFKGFSNASSTPLKGCFYSHSGSDISSSGIGMSPLSPPTFSSDDTPDDSSGFNSYRQIIRGDCFGSDHVYLAETNSICDSPTNVRSRAYVFPGARRGPNSDSYSCEEPLNLRNEFFKLFSDDSRGLAFNRVVAQSEFAGVHFNLAAFSESHTLSTSQYRSADSLPVNESRLEYGGNRDNPSSCFINLPVRDPQIEDRLVPRWLPINQLHNMRYMGLGGAHVQTLNLLTMSLEDILSNPRVYNNSNSVVSTGNSRASIPPEQYIESRYSDNPHRVTPKTPLARVMTSNAAKLPPLNSISQATASQICSTYKVEIGQLDSSGNYLSLAAPKSKNLMRRKEFIATAAWNSTFEDAEIRELERGLINRIPFDDTNPDVTVYEENNSCNSAQRDATQSLGGRSAGELLDVRQFSAGSSASYITGSSFYDHRSFNSSLCHSRYGVQDLIGNIAAWGTEVFSCDTSEERLYIGEKGFVNNSIRIGNATIVDSNLTPWVLGTLDSGRCSPISAGDDRPRRMDLDFIPRSFEVGGAFAPVFDAFGNLNSNLILTPTHDQDAVNQLRNGDGYFLDFGSTGIGPSIDAHDTLALLESTRADYILGDSRRGISFNPVVGLPLECNEGSCTETLDNLQFTTTSLRERIDAGEGNFAVPNFPIGNSDIRSDGLSEWRNNESYSTQRETSSNYTYLESINPNGIENLRCDRIEEGGICVNNPGEDLENFDRFYRTRNEADLEPHSARRIIYTVSRDSTMSLINGGSIDTSRSGRYTASFTSGISRSQYVGARCSVMINMD
jgi:hypothetical protein